MSEKIRTSQDFFEHVRLTDVVTHDADKLVKGDRVAYFGLAAEVGSILSALKKDILSESRDTSRESVTKAELREEIGDALWYLGKSAIIADIGEDLFRGSLNFIHKQLALPRNDRDEVWADFSVDDIKKFNSKYAELGVGDIALDDYQSIAILSSRHQDDALRDTCASLLQYSAAKLLWQYLPNVERKNRDLPAESIEETLYEVLWILSALAKHYNLTLSEVVEHQKWKGYFRNGLEEHDVPDRTFPDHENFPSDFEIAFVPKADRKSVMYWLEGDGPYYRQLGDPLTDNDHSEDGYRYHDAIHIAFAAYLGWSPNLRSFMGLKRKSRPEVDENEDGARAKILEEMIILRVHTHATKIASFLDVRTNPLDTNGALPFEFIRELRELTRIYPKDKSFGEHTQHHDA